MNKASARTISDNRRLGTCIIRTDLASVPLFRLGSLRRWQVAFAPLAKEGCGTRSQASKFILSAVRSWTAQQAQEARRRIYVFRFATYAIRPFFRSGHGNRD